MTVSSPGLPRSKRRASAGPAHDRSRGFPNRVPLPETGTCSSFAQLTRLHPDHLAGNAMVRRAFAFPEAVRRRYLSQNGTSAPLRSGGQRRGSRRVRLFGGWSCRFVNTPMWAYLSTASAPSSTVYSVTNLMSRNLFCWHPTVTKTAAMSVPIRDSL